MSGWRFAYHAAAVPISAYCGWRIVEIVWAQDGLLAVLAAIWGACVVLQMLADAIKSFCAWRGLPVEPEE